MTVYILFGDYSESDGPFVEAVYATRELAEEAKARKQQQWGYYYIEEHDVEEEVWKR